MRPTTDTGNRFGKLLLRLGLLTAATAALVVVSPLSASAADAGSAPSASAAASAREAADPVYCYYKGEKYSEGSVVEQAGIKKTCRNGAWV